MSSMLFIDCWIYDKPSRAVARPATVGKKGGREGGRKGRECGCPSYLSSASEFEGDPVGQWEGRQW